MAVTIPNPRRAPVASLIARLAATPMAASFAAVAAFALAMAPGDLPFSGWDECILGGAAIRWAEYSLPGGHAYDLLVPTGYPYPPLLFWIAGGLVAAIEPAYWVLRLPGAVSLAASAALCALLAAWCGGRAAAWTAGLLAATAVAFNVHDTVSLDYPMSAAILLSLWALLRALDRHSAPWLCASLLAAGLACAFKYYGVIHLAFLAAAVAAHPQLRMLARGPKRRAAVLASAVALPVALALLDGLTFYFYGFGKTHVAETIRTLGWTPFAADPRTGAPIQPGHDYYALSLYYRLGPLLLAAAALGALAAAVQRNRPALWLLAAGLVWFACAEALGTKHFRYILPAIYVLLILAGAAVGMLARTRRGAIVAALLAAGMVLHQSWNASERAGAYLAEARRVEAAFGILRAIPADLPVVAEHAAFQQWDAGALRAFPQPVLTPESPGGAPADLAVLHDAVYEAIGIGALPAYPGYMAVRPEMAQWPALYEAGEGRDRFRILARPGAF